MPSLRSSTDPRHLALIDAAYVIAGDDRPAAPLLGSGFNDGSRDFGVNFGETLQALFDFSTGVALPAAAAELATALFAETLQLGSRGTIGQFGPGQGGPNASTGFSGENPLRLWDVVLTFEGALVSSGAATRRLGAREEARAAFPFTFEPSAAGSGALSAADPNRPRGEVWTPLWGKPASLVEIQALFGEGRLTLGRRAARSGLDASRALVALGAARGINGFERYSLVQPDAKMPYQATPLGRFRTRTEPRDDLVADLDAADWLARVRRATRDKTAPAAARTLMRRLEDALFLMSSSAGPGEQVRSSEGTRLAIEAIGAIALWAAASKAGREAISPPPSLRPGWIAAADDASPEFRVAAALASFGHPHGRDATAGLIPDGVAAHAADRIENAGDRPADNDLGDGEEVSPALRRAPPMAAHLAPVDENTVAGRRRRWAEPNGTQVWSAGPLVANLAAIAARRLVDASARGLADKPFDAATTASLADVAAFLSDGFDHARCGRLLAGLVWARPVRLPTSGAATLPIAYAAMKPLFASDALLRKAVGGPDDLRLPVPPGLLTRLAAGDVATAVALAFARARASGWPVPFAGRTSAFGRGLDGRRLAAALLIPVDAWSLERLVSRAFPKEDDSPEIRPDAA